MPRNKNDHQEYPLLIKIENCPKTAKPDPCSEECTKECLEKSYTIFDPKPPRKRRSTVEQAIEVIQEPISPMASTPERSPIITPVVSQTKKSSSVLLPKEPSVQKTPQPEEKDVGCTLEILVLEKHDRDCKLKKSTAATLDWLKGYNIISHHSVRICQGDTPIQVLAPQPTGGTCDCGRFTKKASCPVCSRLGRRINTPFTSVIQEPPQCLRSISDISEPETYIESVDSGGGRRGFEPDFKDMPIVRQKGERYPFFSKCFSRNCWRPQKRERKKVEPKVPEPIPPPKCSPRWRD
ncbi:uncharacterized protein LOC123683457 [Harmonia axyridis]|uniref:uncharacterized protein LOC123683457 n=1 Tax=Harmonia axyridis TaxID=115357 RepID=UPI001E277EAC|nr:uncharacterized protein LOC123683457 [Harmonia axyridis]